MRKIVFNGRSLHPSKIMCVGKNYAAHIEEMNSVPSDLMTLFMKPNSSITDELTSYRGEPLHFEGEICLLIEHGRVTGIGFGLDLTKRATQAALKAAGLPWERAKAFEGAALFSPFVVAPASLENIVLELSIDGALRQRGGTQHMLYPPSVILKEVQTFLPLEDGDIIMTGTPAGVGPIETGATFTGRILDGERELVSAQWIAC